MPTAEEFLEHYGVAGMKWGKRKARPGPSKDAKRAAATQRKIKAGSVKALTNKELQEFNRRIDLEMKYNKVSPKKVAKGKAALASILATGATANSIIAFANSPAGKGINAALSLGTNKDIVDWKDLKLG